MLAALCFAAAPRTAGAATLNEVSNFGRNPTGLRMFVYVPDTVKPHPAVLVAVHFCTGSGPIFFSGTEFAQLANQFGFIVIYPSATRSGACFDVSTAASLTHNGNSDPVGIVSMVQFVLQNFGADASRVFVTGASSGGMMTNVLIGDYPDVFKAGAAFMGVPFGCFATTDGSLWNTTCANGQSIKTAQQWGDLARGADPGFSATRPRMQLWHGTADATLFFPNFGEEIKQWTNVLGVSATPALTDHPQSSWTRTRYGGTGVNAPVEAISVQGAGHSLPLAGMAALAIQFFGLDKDPTGTPPPPPPPPPPPGGGTGTGTVLINNDWGAGYCAVLTVTNNTTAPITWQVTVPVQGTINNLWNGTFTQAAGSATIRGVDFDGVLQPGQSTNSVGFCAVR
jgi:poly(hydroxyalkanoate) depolymerase family esterase